MHLTLSFLGDVESGDEERLRQALEGVRQLLPRLRDPDYTRVLLITLPEATPVHEAAALQSDLRRAGIEPFGWIVNQSFSDLDTSDPLLRKRARNEIPYHLEVTDSLAGRATLLRWQAEEPTGADALTNLLNQPVTATT